jgi:hypothetical protein
VQPMSFAASSVVSRLSIATVDMPPILPVSVEVSTRESPTVTARQQQPLEFVKTPCRRFP